MRETQEYLCWKTKVYYPSIQKKSLQVIDLNFKMFVALSQVTTDNHDTECIFFRICWISEFQARPLEVVR